MMMKPVEGSSAIAEWGYDEGTREFRVRYKSGGLYSHANVEPSKAVGFDNAPSKGSYFHTYIAKPLDREGRPKHPATRLDRHGE